MRLVQTLQESHPVALLCRVFGIHRSTFNNQIEQTKHIDPELIKLRSLVKEKHKLSNGSAGSRSIAALVTQDGVELSRYRARRLMKAMNLVSCQLPTHAYRKADQPHVSIPNTLDRQFDVLMLDCIQN